MGRVISLNAVQFWKAQFPIVPVSVERMTLFNAVQNWYLQPIITQYFIDNKSEIWLLFLIAHSKR